MCIIEKVFRYEKTDLPITKYKDEIWIKAVAVATILRYKNTKKSIRHHVDPEDKENCQNGAQIQTERNISLGKKREKHNLYQRVWIIQFNT